jgi:hypothetical protein
VARDKKRQLFFEKVAGFKEAWRDVPSKELREWAANTTLSLSVM